MESARTHEGGCLFCGADAPIDDADTCLVRVGPLHPSYETPLSGISVHFRCHSACVVDAAYPSHQQLVRDATTHS